MRLIPFFGEYHKIVLLPKSRRVLSWFLSVILASVQTPVFSVRGDTYLVIALLADFVHRFYLITVNFTSSLPHIIASSAAHFIFHTG